MGVQYVYGRYSVCNVNIDTVLFLENKREYYENRGRKI